MEGFKNRVAGRLKIAGIMHAQALISRWSAR